MTVGVTRPGLAACAGLVIAPLLWAVNVQAGQILPYADCGAAVRLTALLPLFSFVVALGSGWVSWRARIALSGAEFVGSPLAVRCCAGLPFRPGVRAGLAVAGGGRAGAYGLREVKAAGIGLGFLLLLTGVVHAHGVGQDAGPAWTLDPWITVPLLLSAVLYAKGTLMLWARAAAGRGARMWHALAYAAGWLSLAAALVSPLHWMGERLFTAHMIEHEIVMTVAAPLLVLARPGGVFLWAFRTDARRALARLTRSRMVRRGWIALTRPMTATVLHAIAIWVWHVPPFFDAAVTNVVVHRFQHLSFFVTAVLFWWSMLWRSNPGVAAGEIFVTMIHTSILGALITFAPRVLYGAQTVQSEYWGFTPLEDQQLAGLVMWVPVGTVYAGAAIAFFALWVQRSGKGWKADDALAP